MTAKNEANAKGAQPRELPDPARKALLRIARASFEAAVRGHERPPLPKDLPPELSLRRGCFVTLKNGEDLRGCLGHITPVNALAHDVRDLAAQSATEDPRFFGNPITPGELPRITVESSVLSEPKPIANPLDIVLGAHGIIVKGRAGFQGVYLPQVATEWDMSKEEFLSSCCQHKAGLDRNAWRDPAKATVLVFTAEVFSEREHPAGAV